MRLTAPGRRVVIIGGGSGGLAGNNVPGRFARAPGWLAAGWLWVYGRRQARSGHEGAPR